MAKISRHGWSSDFRGNSCTSDELERFKDGIRDDIAGRTHERGTRYKAVHVHAKFGESRDVSYVSDEEIWLKEAEHGNIQCQYLLGKKLLARGELCGAARWLGKAADKGWPGAEEELAKLRAGTS